ncbi:MAG: hypothetical protein H6607_13360 [Flavobacteriales bacterium]|nr:hypothetical protein [Flavobacteriales bacterium]
MEEYSEMIDSKQDSVKLSPIEAKLLAEGIEAAKSGDFANQNEVDQVLNR